MIELNPKKLAVSSRSRYNW